MISKHQGTAAVTGLAFGIGVTGGGTGVGIIGVGGNVLFAVLMVEFVAVSGREREADGQKSVFFGQVKFDFSK